MALTSLLLFYEQPKKQLCIVHLTVYVFCYCIFIYCTIICCSGELISPRGSTRFILALTSLEQQNKTFLKEENFVVLWL